MSHREWREILVFMGFIGFPGGLCITQGCVPGLFSLERTACNNGVLDTELSTFETDNHRR
jgi:hypothetical protein